MLYALLCYNDEDMVYSWTQEEDAAVMAKIRVVQERLIREGKLGPSLRLLPTTSATSVRKTNGEPLVIDGPYAETKEQLLGFYILDVENLEEALAVTRELGEANPTSTYEIRPVGLYFGDERGTASA
ncbi:YciI family protein [Phenylobacterium sp. LjRoot225]|uniref:YciI family protein n=1 Tax=Phenylobacterium sp. LjRoot225 TaxID=3342285 RepID=UPI003ED0153C